MHIISTRRLRSPIHLCPGDRFVMHHTDEAGKDHTLLTYEVEERLAVDILHVIEFEPGDLGLERGIGGVFGKEAK